MLPRPIYATLSAAFLLISGSLASADDFPKGKFLADLNGVQWTIKFGEKGTFEVARDDETIAEGTFKVAGEEVELADEKGPAADPNSGPGKYTWKIDGKKLTLKKVEDAQQGRVDTLTAKPWTRAD